MGYGQGWFHLLSTEVTGDSACQARGRKDVQAARVSTSLLLKTSNS